ncbi:MFS general substrate transporter [Periconia macrospinosa]|uniref:MFS general substrate transporter n=1 Tax=Periconia macrospinosa TaxID=97972 RepID=A0A2V1E7J3_9PLEO|nr:MFS general substrate transporter [Periconia macrospinosa]
MAFKEFSITFSTSTLKGNRPRFFLFIEIGYSSFGHSDLASWITTSYLLTNIFGRRECLLAASALFGFGCLGCSVSTNMMTLIIMRAITGLGGGGLMTMTTIVNSDLIPTKHRGMYQALQNVVHGAGSVAGATFGGVLLDATGWRFCFMAQVPSSADCRPHHFWQRLDLAGASLLFFFFGLVLQLAAMSLGIGLLIASFVTIIAFVFQEYRCEVAPILPLYMLWGGGRAGMLISNVALGVTAYGLLLLMPLFFQTVLLGTASIAGLRLIPASLATPLGGLITGLSMRRGVDLTVLTRTGLLLCLIGTLCILTLGIRDPGWKYSAVLIPGNLGSGILYPSLLFSIIGASDVEEHAVSTSLAYLTRSMGTIIEKLKHSTAALRDIDPERQAIAISVYYSVCYAGFYFILAITSIAVLCSFLVSTRTLRRL